MTDLRIALIGAGGIGREHARAYAAVGGARVVAVAEVDEARGRVLADEVGATWYGDWMQALARDDVDAVSVCLPHSMHADAAVDAARAGKHVLCEKPIATTLIDADRIIAACREAGVTLMVGHTHRFWLEHLEMKRLLDEGAIGRLLQVRDVIFAGRPTPRPELGWRSVSALNGGGIYMDNGVHGADRLAWWVGAKPVSVAASLGHDDRENSKNTRGRSGREREGGNGPRPGGERGETHGQALIRFANGVSATLEVAQAVPIPYGDCYAELMGTEGAMRVDTWQRLRIAQYGDKEWRDVPVPTGRLNGFDAEIAEFLAAIREKRAPSVTGEDGRAALELIQAIYRANETGEVVRL